MLEGCGESPSSLPPRQATVCPSVPMGTHRERSGILLTLDLLEFIKRLLWERCEHLSLVSNILLGNSTSYIQGG